MQNDRILPRRQRLGGRRKRQDCQGESVQEAARKLAAEYPQLRQIGKVYTDSKRPKQGDAK